MRPLIQRQCDKISVMTSELSVKKIARNWRISLDRLKSLNGDRVNKGHQMQVFLSIFIAPKERKESK